jgi:hypothetical protein
MLLGATWEQLKILNLLMIACDVFQCHTKVVSYAFLFYKKVLPYNLLLIA